MALLKSWNRYTYVLNNPLAYVDPTGEIVCALPSGDYVEAETDDKCYGMGGTPWVIVQTVTVNGGSDTGGNLSTDPTYDGSNGPGNNFAMPTGPSGNSSGFHFQLLPTSLRLPGESRLACIDRVQKALLGDTGQSVLATVSGLSLASSVVSYSGTIGLAQAGPAQELLHFAPSAGPQLMVPTELSGTSIIEKTVTVGLQEGSISPAVTSIAGARTFAAGLFKVSGLLTAIGLGLEGGFAVACR